MKQPLNIGNRVVVHGMSEHGAYVKSITWEKKEIDWLIQLDWGIYGSSRIWARDENVVWYRYSTVN